MQPNYIVKDDKGNSGQSISFTQGESRLVTLYLLQSNGLPFVIPGTIATAVIKIFKQISAASIQKTLAGGTVTMITIAGGADDTKTFGFEFLLTPADTASMAANNSGLPMIATLTDSLGNVFEFDFLSIFNVSMPAVQT